MKYDLSIIGLGYVGLPLGLQFAKSGCRVLGLDIDPGKLYVSIFKKSAKNLK